MRHELFLNLDKGLCDMNARERTCAESGGISVSYHFHK